MEYRKLGRTGWEISAISFGAWAIGGTWGHVDDRQSLRALHRAVELGVNFFDTADVYGDGRSERLLAKLRHECSKEIYIATKTGRHLNPHVAERYNRKNLTQFIQRSLKNLRTDSIDLLQLHCPPTQVYYMPEVFAMLDDLVRGGKIRFYGVSVEKVEEALKAIEYPHVQSVQIIFNMFRHRPAQLFFEQARKRQVGILARVPLASGLLTGKLRSDSEFESDDHRHFNRQGEMFDRGETFSGIDYETGLKAVDQLKTLRPTNSTLAMFALRWILMFDAVSAAIPGAKTEKQVEENVSAVNTQPISEQKMQAIQDIYNQYIKKDVHHLW